MYVRQIFGGSTPPKYLTDVCPSNTWGIYTSKYLTDVDPSNISGVYIPEIFNGFMSVNYMGGLHVQNI